jgi:pilus assembly protein Flp/PilA
MITEAQSQPHGGCLKDESGATAIEYGLIAAGISVVIIATVNAIGTSLNAKFDSISTQLK